MSRRKQSNPKPLKVDEAAWNEGEDGKQTKKPEEEAGSPKNLIEAKTDNHSTSSEVQGQDGSESMDLDLKASMKESTESDRADPSTAKSRKYPTSEVKVPAVSGRSLRSINGGSSHSKERSMGQSELIRERSRSRSRASDLGEYGEIEMSETEECDDRRKSHRERHSGSSRSRTPEIHSSEMNGSVSSQQILQSLPYFHLLPPAIRNDAARLLFMPPMLPTDLANASLTAVPGPSSHTSAVNTDKNSAGESTRTGPAYFCKPCNIKFSSTRTLDAHQTYYCSFRRDPENEDIKGDLDGDSRSELMTNAAGGPKKRERESLDEDHELTADESMDISDGGRSNFLETADMNSNKMTKTGKLYSCMYCSYSADKKVSLNRHMRMHSGPPLASIQISNNSNDEPPTGSGSTTPNIPVLGSNIGINKNLPEGVNALERYCQDCDIQFSSLKTYRVHKQYYCRTRHVLKSQQSTVSAATGSPSPISMKAQSSVELASGITVTPVRKSSGSPVPSESSPVSTPGPMSSQPFLVLPTSPIIVVPYCYIQAASILTGNVLPSQNALVVLPNGSVQSLPFTSVPMPISSPVSQPGGMVPFMQSSFSAGSSIKNNGIGTSNVTHGSSVSPTSQSHSVFNDPKDILKRISSVSKNSPHNTDSVSCESGGSSGYKNSTLGTSHNSSNETIQSDNGSHFKEKLRSAVSDANLNENHDGNSVIETGSEENMPAIDLTLRRTHSQKEISGDDEKENREVFLRFRSHSGDHSQDSHGGDVNMGRRSTGGVPFTDFHRDRELSSPSERLSIPSGSCGKRTPRPSSTSISSSCSTPPALCEPKVNGITARLSPGAVEHDGATRVNSRNSMMMSMMIQPTVNLGDIQMKKVSVDFSAIDMAKHRGATNNFSEPKARRGKMSPIATQLPGGAILTTASNQSLTELLKSSPEFNESLAKLNPQLLINARSAAGSPIGLNPVLLQALSQADPEVVMKMFDPVYLTNLQHTIQQQQQLQKIPLKRGYSKCIDCDIVFYKHDNYVVHKERYCAARTANSSPNATTSEKDNHINRGKRDHQNQSRMSSCSSPARSELEADECNSPPTQVGHGNHSQKHIRLPRKSTDSSSSEFFPQPAYESLSKSKSKSPNTVPTSISVSPVPSSRDTNTEKQVGGSQYPCLQCGVKYSTVDNLKAHQSFYCTKRGNINEVDENGGDDAAGVKIEEDEDREIVNHQTVRGNPLNSKGLLRCNKCKLAIPEDQLSTHSRVCIGSNGSVQPISNSAPFLTTGVEGRSAGSGWKCPCCDTYSPTVSAAQKHLEVHTGIRAFKCLLCGYRGNTLRGMRTHIRTHFDKRVSDLLEGEYMTCITANELEQNVTTPVTPNKSYSLGPEARTADLNHRNEPTNRLGAERQKLNSSPNSNSVTSSSPTPPQESGDVKVFAMAGTGGSVTELENNNRLNYCNLCNYSSSYRGNVIRHMKLVHKISEEAAEKIICEMNMMKALSPTDSEDSPEAVHPKIQEHSSDLSKNTKGSEKSDASSEGLPSNENFTSRKISVNGIEDREDKSESDIGRKCSGRSSSTSTEEDIGGLSSVQKKEKPCAVKYCKSCDIYFNHLSTFNAHKKLYCSAGLNNETVERAETPVQ